MPFKAQTLVFSFSRMPKTCRRKKKSWVNCKLPSGLCSDLCTPTCRSWGLWYARKSKIRLWAPQKLLIKKRSNYPRGLVLRWVYLPSSQNEQKSRSRGHPSQVKFSHRRAWTSQNRAVQPRGFKSWCRTLSLRAIMLVISSFKIRR